MKPSSKLSRREFIKTCSLSLAGLFLPTSLHSRPTRLPDVEILPSLLGRVTRSSIPVRAEPSEDSPRKGKLLRDEVVELLDIVESPQGPTHNPRWYQVEQGYIHSAYIQRVQDNPSSFILDSVPAGGLIGQITVPFVQSHLRNHEGYWVKLYRLYYSSVHWITGLEQSPSGEILYKLTDEWLRVSYYAPASSIQLLSPSDYSSITTSVSPDEKRLEVSLQDQLLTAFEGDLMVRQCKVSTGVRYMETPSGDFQIQRKFPSKHMGNGGLTSDSRAYELVGVPWATFFHDAGIAFHGTFWHDNFGAPMSHGCVNMTNPDALWLFRWTMPSYLLTEGEKPLWKVSGNQGTQVVVK